MKTALAAPGTTMRSGTPEMLSPVAEDTSSAQLKIKSNPDRRCSMARRAPIAWIFGILFLSRARSGIRARSAWNEAGISTSMGWQASESMRHSGERAGEGFGQVLVSLGMQRGAGHSVVRMGAAAAGLCRFLPIAV